MSRDINLLDNVKVASPCAASWAEMRGDDRVRFCESCKLHVYNFAEMTRAEAEALIIEKEGNLCVRLYQRPDGTMITKDCPVGLRAVRERFARVMGRIAAAFAILLGAAGALGTRGHINNRLRSMEPFSCVYAWFAPPRPTTILGSLPRPFPFRDNALCPIDDSEN